jgi:hypothetical protein
MGSNPGLVLVTATVADDCVTQNVEDNKRPNDSSWLYQAALTGLELGGCGDSCSFLDVSC